MCRESRKERSLGKVVTALVDNIITPLIGILVGGLDFTGLSVKVGEATIGYGAFIQAVINSPADFFRYLLRDSKL